jgi:hypothetical protein
MTKTGKSFTAKDANLRRKANSFTAKDTKDAKEITLQNPP